MSKGSLYVISGPSGVGKGAICKQVLEADEKIKFSVSMTTRAPRAGEVDGVDYFFVTKDEFENLIYEGGLLEYNQYVDNYYGTPRKQIVDWLEEGYDVMLEIDYHGAFNVRNSYPESILLFILPPSKEELKARIVGRGSESDEVIEKRLAEAMHDLAQADKYDYRIVNINLDDAVREVRNIINDNRSEEA